MAGVCLLLFFLVSGLLPDRNASVVSLLTPFPASATFDAALGRPLAAILPSGMPVAEMVERLHIGGPERLPGKEAAGWGRVMDVAPPRTSPLRQAFLGSGGRAFPRCKWLCTYRL